MHRLRAALVPLVVLVVVACSSTSPGAQQTEATASVAPTDPPSISPVPTPMPTRTAPALVGMWLGMHSCQRIVDIMVAAGMPEQALLNAAESGTIPGVSTIDDIADPEEPCVGATDKPHWHFFNADGEFGSLDMNRQKVDFGTWMLVDADTLTIEGTPFTFRVDGDQLHMRPENVGTCPVNGKWCAEAWKLMVAMPGTAWTRDD